MFYVKVTIPNLARSFGLFQFENHEAFIKLDEYSTSVRYVGS